MRRSRTKRLGELQLRILRTLWEREEATVSDVHAVLDAESPLAYTTAATMLRKMEDRGLVEHRAEGRRFIYCAAVREDEVSRSMAADILDRLFDGSVADMVSHLLRDRDVPEDELRRIESLVRERRKR